MRCSKRRRAVAVTLGVSSKGRQFLVLSAGSHSRSTTPFVPKPNHFPTNCTGSDQWLQRPELSR